LFVGNVYQTEEIAIMFNSVNTHREARNPIWDTVLITAATIIISALIFAITTTSMTSPQPDHASMTMKIMVDEQAKLLHTLSKALLILALVALPPVILSLVLPRSKAAANHPTGQN
jgi:hypothetical protein